jgi:hypothetical protein
LRHASGFQGVDDIEVEVRVRKLRRGVWNALARCSSLPVDDTWFDDKPRWGPNGRMLYFVSNRTGVASVWGRRFDSSTGTPIGDPAAQLE